VWPFDSKKARKPARSSPEVRIGEILRTVDLDARVRAALEPHPAVRAVRLVGSRARGETTELSDWDFEVEAADFDALAGDLPDLVRELEPIGQLWDPYSDEDCYMLMLPGAVKVDFIFPDRPRTPGGPWVVSRDTLRAIDTHFWDWILWIRQKIERDPDRAVPLLEQMHKLMLRPMGVKSIPISIAEAVDSYLQARDEIEQGTGLLLDRHMEDAVRARLRGAGI
jgi:predicted nucleotidyltransferase